MDQRKYKKIVVLIAVIVLIVLILSLSVHLMSPDRSTDTRSEATTDGASESISAKIKIDGKKTHEVSKKIWGVNHDGFSRYSAGDTQTILSELKIRKNSLDQISYQTIRVPGGCPADNYHWETAELIFDVPKVLRDKNVKIPSVDEFLALADSMNAELVYQVNIDHLGTANPCGDTSKYKGIDDPVERKNQMLNDTRKLVKQYKDKITYWELGNEQNLTWSVEDLMDTGAEFSKVIKEEDNDSIVILPVPGLSEQDKIDKVKQRIVEKCGQKPCYDVVAYHPYPAPGYASDQEFSDKQGRIAYFGLSAFKPVIDGISSTYGTLGKKSAFTEWNVTCWTGEKGLISAEHAMAVAEAQLVMSENENVILSSYHAFAQGSCGHFDQNEHDTSSGDGLNIMGNAYRLTVPPDYNSVSSVEVSVKSPVQTVDLGGRCWAGEEKCNGDMGTFPIVSSYAMESGKKLVIVIFNRDQTKEADIHFSLDHLKQYENSKLVKVSTLHANAFIDNKFIEKTSNADTFSNLQVPPISITRLEIQQEQEPTTTSPISPTDSAINQPLQTQASSSTSSPAATTPTSTSYYGGYSTLTPSPVDYLPDTNISGSDAVMIFFSSGVTLTSALIIKKRVHKRFEDRVTDDS